MKKSLLITALILLSSCVQPLEIEPQWEEPPVIVHCVLKRNSSINIAEQYTTQTVELCYASATGQDEFAKVQEAEVTVYDKDRKKAFTFTNEGNGVWTSEFTPDYDCTYCLEIKIPGRETITAETRVPEKVEVLKFGFSIGYGDESLKAQESMIEKAGLVPPEKEMGGGIIGCVLGSTKEDYRTKHDVYVWIRHGSGCDLATDHIYADDCNVTSRLYTADLFTPEEIADRFSYGKGVVPCCFGLPLHKGFLRIVNPTDYCRSVPGKYGWIGTDGEGNNVVISDPVYGRMFVILGDFTYKSPSTLEESDYLEARVVSEELDKYYRDVYSYNSTKMDNVFNMVYSSSESISSNIKNGYGIFGVEVIHKMIAYDAHYMFEN